MSRRVLAAALVLVGVFSLGLALAQLTGPLRLPAWLSGSAEAAPGDALPPSRPTRLTIPSLDLRAKIHPVGLDERGAIAAPALRKADQAGWYEEGPTPGQYGAAVIVGHVDDARGPAVFHDLASIRPGTRIEITRRDRRDAVFQVTEVRSYDKSALPADEVYGDFRLPELRLITCGGRWLGGETGYADNLVVFARLIRP
jgi:hypothetical protein